MDFVLEVFVLFQCSITNIYPLRVTGHYVPQLANLIHEKNKGAKKGYSINLKGILVYKMYSLHFHISWRHYNLFVQH